MEKLWIEWNEMRQHYITFAEHTLFARLCAGERESDWLSDRISIERLKGDDNVMVMMNLKRRNEWAMKTVWVRCVHWVECLGICLENHSRTFIKMIIRKINRETIVGVWQLIRDFQKGRENKHKTQWETENERDCRIWHEFILTLLHSLCLLLAFHCDDFIIYCVYVWVLFAYNGFQGISIMWDLSSSFSLSLFCVYVCFSSSLSLRFLVFRFMNTPIKWMTMWKKRFHLMLHWK